MYTSSLYVLQGITCLHLVLGQTNLSKQCRPRSDVDNVASDQSLSCLTLIQKLDMFKFKA